MQKYANLVELEKCSNAYFLAKFRFDTAENEPAKNLQKFADRNPLTLLLCRGRSDLRAHNHALDAAEERAFDARRKAEQEKENFSYFARRTLGENATRRM